MLFFLVLGTVAGLSSRASAEPGAAPRYATAVFVLVVAGSVWWRIGA